MAWIGKLQWFIRHVRGLAVVAILAMILAGTSLSAVALPRSQDYNCVSYTISQTRPWVNRTVMHHLPTHQSLSYQRSISVPSYQPRENSSPDGRYSIGLHGDGGSFYNLRLSPAAPTKV